MKKVIQDWNAPENGIEDKFDLEVDSTETNTVIKIKNQETGLYLEICVEVDRGVPAFHVWGTEGSDALLHAHRTQEGLVVNPEHDIEPRQIPDPIYGDTKPALFFEEEYVEWGKS